MSCPILKASTTKLKWWLGRKLKLRTHIAVYLLEQMLNERDRKIEARIKENAAYQLFCGRTIVDNWHCPDHTKIETFRSRLTTETQQTLANSVAALALKHQFANPSDIDIDATVQEANIQYPAISNLLIKAGVLAKRVREERTLDHFYRKALSLIHDVHAKCFEGATQFGKIISFHLDEVACFNKSKADKKIQFGRTFQLARLAGNFLFVGKCTSVRMPDAGSLTPMIEEHQQLFPSHKLNSVAADKGYYSKQNEQYLLDLNVTEVGLQKPSRPLRKPPDNAITPEIEKKLYDRRSGIEASIGQLKNGGQMGRSRMKLDHSTESSGYCAVLGFNLRQMARYLTGEAVMIAN